MSTSTSPISPIVLMDSQASFLKESFIVEGDYERARTMQRQIAMTRRVAPKCYFAIPSLALLGSVFTYSQLILGHMTENEKSWQIGEYAGMATAGVVGLSFIATAAEVGIGACSYGSEEACSVFKRSFCWLRKPEGIIANTFSAVCPLLWPCWCRGS